MVNNKMQKKNICHVFSSNYKMNIYLKTWKIKDLGRHAQATDRDAHDIVPDKCRTYLLIILVQ